MLHQAGAWFWAKRFFKIEGFTCKHPLATPPPPPISPCFIKVLFFLQFFRNQNARKFLLLECLSCRLTEQAFKCPGKLQYETCPLKL